EDFICIHEVGNLQRRFLNLDACSAQQLNGAPARNSGEECTVQRRGLDHAVFDHKQVGGAGLCHVAQHVKHEGVVKAARLRLHHAACVVGVKAPSLGIGRHGFH